jgi:peptide-methionine (R)-S-oxide reductase
MNKNPKFDEKVEKLTPMQFHITQEHGTEPRFSGELLHNDEDGAYNCVVCGAELFSSDTKFDSKSGWPSFSDVAEAENIELLPDNSHGMQRTEVRCKVCGAHLGHVFDVDDYTDSGKYYCINSAALEFEKTKA